MNIIINKELAEKVLTVVDAGLVNGVGNPTPGKMCIEAAVNYACGLPHGDNPPCVGGAVRRFKIELNDANWSSAKARAAGMRKIAIAQLGSNTLNQIEFAERMAIKNVQIVLPALFRKLKMDEEISQKCENANDLESAESAAKWAAKSAESAARWAARWAAKSAESAAKWARWAAKSAAKWAAESAEWAAEWAAKSANPDYFLKLSADVCLQVLIDMKSPGCEYLFLAE